MLCPASIKVDFYVQAENIEEAREASIKEDMKNVGLLELSGLLEEIFNNILSV